MKEHLTYNEAASTLGLTPARIGQLVRAGKISSGPKVGRSKTVEEFSLSKYARENNMKVNECLPVEVEDGSGGIEKFRILETKNELLKKENDWLNVEIDKKTQELQATHEDISSLKKEIREQLQEIRLLQLQEKKCKCGFRLEGKEEKESGICKFCKAKNE